MSSGYLQANSAPASAQMKIDKITGQLANPWGMTLIDNKHILVTLRAGQLVQISLSSGIATPVGNLPDIVSKGQGGLLDILYHKGEVFLCYSAPQSGRNTATSVLRAASITISLLIENRYLPVISQTVMAIILDAGW